MPSETAIKQRQTEPVEAAANCGAYAVVEKAEIRVADAAARDLHHDLAVIGRLEREVLTGERLLDRFHHPTMGRFHGGWVSGHICTIMLFM